MRIPSLEFFDRDTIIAEEFIERLRRTCEERSERKDWDKDSRKQ